MTTCWEVLGIAPSTDRKVVKRAYSKQLKSTRPDDDPAAFQLLYEAYQTALAEAAGDLGGVATIEAEWPANELKAAEPSSSGESALPTQEPLSAEKQQEVDALVERLDQLLTRPLQLPNPSNWSFLTDTASLLDDGFRVGLGRAVMQRIVNYENDQRQRKKRIDEVSGAIITRLDNAYLWSAYPMAFADSLDLGDLFGVLGRIDPEMRRTHTLPMGGEIVSNYEAPRERDPAFERPSGFSGEDFGNIAIYGVALLLAFAAFAGRCST